MMSLTVFELTVGKSPRDFVKKFDTKNAISLSEWLQNSFPNFLF
jgi:hypothetical protein